jgi:hypothetical protein
MYERYDSNWFNPPNVFRNDFQIAYGLNSY